jgi:hypothetical protein
MSSSIPDKVTKRLDKIKEKQRINERAKQILAEINKKPERVDPLPAAIPQVEILKLTTPIIEAPSTEVIKTVIQEPAILIAKVEKPSQKIRGRPRKDGTPAQARIKSIDDLPAGQTVEQYSVIVSKRKGPEESCHGITVRGERCRNYIFDEEKKTCKIHSANYTPKSRRVPELSTKAAAEERPTNVEENLNSLDKEKIITEVLNNIESS